MNLTTALSECRDNNAIAIRFGISLRDVIDARRAAHNAPSLVVDDEPSRAETDWQTHAETASTALRDAVRAYWSKRRVVDWEAWDRLEVERQAIHNLDCFDSRHTIARNRR